MTTDIKLIFNLTIGFYNSRYTTPYIAPNFREIAENPMIENFRDKIFVIATFFHDYHRAAASVWTIHVIATSTIACGSALG